MPNKSFSIYSKEDFTIDESDYLVLEIAKLHVACIARKGDRKQITACELFSCSEQESDDLESLLARVSQLSKILGQKPLPGNVNVFINNEYCIPVPIFKFNKEIAVDYLDLVFGADYFSKVRFEHVAVEPGIMNVYRLTQKWYEVLQHHFKKAEIRHTYSSIIRSQLSKSEGSGEELVAVHFYNSFMIVAVVKRGVLHLIQTFQYETPDDVLYHLLNVSARFDLYRDSVPVHISGMIDKEFKLYRELITYFKMVNVELVHSGDGLLQTGDYPRHYFTPYFKLAL